MFEPIQSFADLATYAWLGLARDSYLGAAINFFIYDVIKIGLLLVGINYVMAISRYYLPVDKVRDILTKRRWFGLDYLFSAALGVLTPFCSCSSIPLFIGFLGAGIPLGVTFAFLISSPLVNEASLYLFPAMFGWNVTILYNLLGMAIAMLGGVLIQKLGVEKYVRREFLKIRSRAQVEAANNGLPLPGRKLLAYFWQDGMSITKQVFPYVLLGVGIGAAIHGFVPRSITEQFLSTRAWWTVPLAVLLGAPLYVNSIGVIPVMEALVDKGVPLGTALSFMTATVTISIPEALMLKKVMSWQLLGLFLGITSVGIIAIGYIFNWLF